MVIKMSKVVLVVGGAGYIGSHICKTLKKNGFQPVVYDTMEQGHPWAVQWSPLSQGNVLDTERIIQVLKEYQPIGVIHLAAYHNVRESALYPEKYYTNNCQGTLSLLQAMTKCQVKFLVFSSSAAIYGHPHYTPIDEEHPKSPISPYGRSKWFVEQMLADFDIHSVCLRYFNAAGADTEGEIGEAHDPETHLIPLAILAAHGEKPPLQIFGDDHETPDGTPIRDYIHVMDLANAHLLSLQWLLENKESISFNLGSGRGYSVKEVVEMTERILERKVPYSVSKRSPYDPPVLIADPRKANRILGWQPEFSDLKTLIETANQWHLKSHETSTHLSPFC